MASNTIPYADRAADIRRELERRARSGRTISYSELGRIVGIPQNGPWKPVLDWIARQEASRGEPDITYLVVSKRTGYPSQIDLRAAKPPTEAQKRSAERVWVALNQRYAG